MPTNSTCFPCNINQCDPLPEPYCPPKPCNLCEDSYLSKCIFITDKLMCSNGTFYVAADVNLNDAISSLICKINELETKVTFIMNNCCTGLVNCDYPVIISINE